MTALPRLAPGIAPREMVDAIERELRQTLKAARGSPQRATVVGLQRLRAAGAITDSDLARLRKVSDTLFAVEKRRLTTKAALTRIDGLYREALFDPRATDLGTNTINVAYSRSDGKLMGAIILSCTVFGILVGIAVGSGAGGAAGGELGGTIGGIIGAAVGIALGACAESE